LREELHLSGGGQASDDRDGVEYGRPPLIDGGEDLVGQGAELIDLAVARQPWQHNTGHRNDPL
jgi:hypothetical protein